MCVYTVFANIVVLLSFLLLFVFACVRVRLSSATYTKMMSIVLKVEILRKTVCLEGAG